MKIEGIRFNEEYWGKPYESSILYRHVYLIHTEKCAVIVIPQKTAASIISEKAISFATKKGGLLYYEYYVEGKAVRYELGLRYLFDCDDPAKAKKIWDDLKEKDRFGRVDLPGYFGECSPPSKAPSGAVKKAVRIDNGIYLVRSSGKDYLAVYTLLLESDLPVPLHRMAKVIKNYAFYDKWSCAPVFHELVHNPVTVDAKAIKKYVCSWDDLYSAINKRFGAYRRQYNELITRFQKPIPVIVKSTDDEFINWTTLDSRRERAAI